MIRSTCLICSEAVDSDDGLNWKHTARGEENCGTGHGDTALPQWYDDVYRSNLPGVIEVFAYELCAECGADLDRHIIAPDILGLPHAYCADATPL